MKDLQIKYALAIADCGNITEASRRLYVSQPALSKQVADLEAELGVNIFIRTSKGVELTPEGEIVIDTFRQMKRLMTECMDKIHFLVSENKKVLSVGCLAALIPRSILSRAINACIRQIPGSSIIFEYKNHDELNDNLKNGIYDVILSFETSVDPTLDVEHALLSVTPYALAFSASHRLNKSGEIDYALIKSLDFYVQAPRGTAGFDDYLALITKHFKIPKSQIKSVPNVDSLFSNVEIGLGVALLPASPAITSNPSISYRTIEESPQRTVAFWKKGTGHSFLHLFIKTLHELLSNDSIDKSDI